jgi:oxygen-independent coproporphyrinogen-3 oxidase
MANMGLSHLSCYQLTIEQGTVFFSDVKRGAWRPLDSDRQADFMEETRGVLEKTGYAAYEISNYARPGMECRHNLHVWRYGEYLGTGAGAHGRVWMDGQRTATQNRKAPADYLTRVTGAGDALVEKTEIVPADAWREAVMVGLRLQEGICLERLTKVIHTPPAQSGLKLGQMGHLRDMGLLWQRGSAWGTTPQGWLLLDSMLEAIF